LRQGDAAALARECYFIALTKLKNREYADFLVLLASFQESALRSLVKKKINVDLRAGKDRTPTQIWQEISRVEGGALQRYLDRYEVSPGNCLSTKGFMNATVMTAILSYYSSDFSNVEPALDALKKYVQDRNAQVHRLEGVSHIEDEDGVLSNLRKILKQVISVPQENPFDRLNQEILDSL
jgi:hypothetical protein